MLATDNVDPIPDGSVLYTCKVNIAAGAAGGDYALAVTGVILSDPDGNAIAGATGQDGTVTVGGSGPQPTPTPSIAACIPPAVRPDPVHTSSGAAAMAFRLLTGGYEIAGVQVDLEFAAGARIAAKANGMPDCAVNADIDKGATSFAFRPSGCSGVTCTGIRALVLATDNVVPIPDGSVLFTCQIQVSATSRICVSNPIGSNPAGDAIPSFGGCCADVAMSAPCDAPAIQAPSFDAQPGTTVEFNVTLLAGTNQVAGTQNDIGFQPKARIAAKANGKPDCTVNPSINKGATSFAFRPSGCSGETCTGIRALVLATDNVDPIPDGSVLYTCKVTVAADANSAYPLDVTGMILSDTDGNAIAGASGCDGAIIVGAACAPTAVDVDTVHAIAGSTVDVLARIRTGGLAVAGAQVDIAFDSRARIATRWDGTPNCAVNPDIDKWGTSFAFLPFTCGGPSCIGIRAVVVALNNVSPIPDGAVLFTCAVDVAPDAVGTVPLTASHVVLGDPDGNAIEGAHGCDGGVVVEGPVAELRVGNVTVGPAQSGAGIPISLGNGTTVRALQFTITDIPDEISLNGYMRCATTARASALLCDANQVGNEIRVVMLSTGYGGIAPGSGQIATVYVDDSWPTCSTGASSFLYLSQTALADASGNPIPHVTYSGSVECACKGNIDGNGVTDVFDALLCVDFSIGKKYPSAAQRSAADVRCDGVIDIFDCLAVVDVILGRLPVCPPCQGGTAASGEEVTVGIMDASAAAGATVHVTVTLDNPTTAARGLQFDLPVTDRTLRLNGVSTTERSQGLVADAHQDTDGTIRVLAMSVDETAIAAGTGGVLELALTVESGARGSVALAPAQARAAGDDGPLPTNTTAGSLAVQSPSGSGSGCQLTAGPTQGYEAAWLWGVSIAVVLRLVGRRRRRVAR